MLIALLLFYEEVFGLVAPGFCDKLVTFQNPITCLTNSTVPMVTLPPFERAQAFSLYTLYCIPPISEKSVLPLSTKYPHAYFYGLSPSARLINPSPAMENSFLHG